jgi:hypothetical protein
VVLYQKLQLSFKVIIVGLTVLSVWAKRQQTPALGTWLICSLLISGYGNSFSLILLLLPAVYYYPLLKDKHRLLMLFVILLFIIANVPFNWFQQFPVLFKFPRLYAMLMLFALLVYLSRATFRWYYIAIPILVCILPVTPKINQQNYFLEKQEAALMCDFNVGQQELVISYFNSKGPIQKIIPWSFTVTKINEVKAPDGIARSEHVKSYLINDSLQLYLSDENRGVGFYALRKKVLY